MDGAAQEGSAFYQNDTALRRGRSPIISRTSAHAMKPRLLLVDDDPLIAESLAFVLEADYEVACASDRE